jgi:hypothetical protein
MRLALVAAALVLAACAGDPLPLTNCTAGVQVPCACPDGSSGAQRCAADGSGFGACMCEGRDAATPPDSPVADVVDVQLAPDVVAVDAPRDVPRDVAVADAGSDVVDAPPADRGCTPSGGTICCGATECPSLPGAVVSCDADAGGLACTMRCMVDFADCDHDASNGCEADLRTNRNNCGICGRSCAPYSCLGSACAVH